MRYLLFVVLLFCAYFNNYAQDKKSLDCEYTISAMVVEYSLPDSFIRVQLHDEFDTNIYVLHIVESPNYIISKKELFKQIYIGSEICICDKEFEYNLDLNHTKISVKGILFIQ